MKEKKIYTKSSENIKIIVNPHRRGSGNLEHSRHSKNKSLKFGEGLTACIDDYEIQEKIDEISFLLLALHIPTQKVVCLKLTDLTISYDYEFIDHVISNVNNCSLFQHRNLLPQFSSFIDNENLWSTTIPIFGSAIHIMQNQFPDGLPEVAVATILKYVIRALSYLHEEHIIHNDIKADNFLIEPTGDVRLGGFRQIRKLQTCGEIQKSIFTLVGDNIEWAAPEVIVQNSNYTIKADLYSLGIAALELMYNKTPFCGWDAPKVLLCKLNYECPAVPSEKKCSKHFFKFVNSCTQKDPHLRPDVNQLLDMPFLKQAKGASYLENIIIKKYDPSKAEISGTDLVSNKSIEMCTPNGDCEKLAI